MRRKLFNLACLVVAISGCAAESADGIRNGTPITHVQAEHGLPDVICDTSGDQARYYVPTDRPEDEWPADAPRTFYYLKKNLAVTFVLGKAINVSPIEADLRSAVLLPLVARHAFDHSCTGLNSRNTAMPTRCPECGTAVGGKC